MSIGTDGPARETLSPTRLNAIETEDGIDALVGTITDPNRTLPVIVVTRSRAAEAPFVDAASLCDQLEGMAFVATVTAAALMWRLTSFLPDHAVYGGAMRLFPPPDRDGDLSPERCLHLVYDVRQAERASERVVDDVMGMMAGSFSSRADAPVSVRREVVVDDVIDGTRRALCRFGRRGICTVSTAEVCRAFGLDDVVARRLFRKGMRLSGTYHEGSRTLTDFVEGVRMGADEALAPYEPGMTVPARVTGVSDETCELELFPGVHVAVDAENVAAEPLLPSDVLATGQVVPVLVVERGASVRDWLLSVLEADEEDVAPAAALLAGGPPWLEVTDIPSETAQGTAAEETATSEGPSLPPASEADIDAEIAPPDAGPNARRVLMGLYSQLTLAQERLNESRRELEQTQVQLAASKDRLRKSGGKKGGKRRYRKPTMRFLDERERLDYESRRLDFQLYEMWLEMMVPAEREHNPLPRRWSYGENLFDTIAEVDVAFDKVLRCMVDMLLGRFGGARQTHQLRTGNGAEDPARKGPNGEPIWRSCIEIGKAQAARLHFMRLADGTIEFLSVRRHDDMRT